jgi:4-alpha-glucanotransferase
MKLPRSSGVLLHPTSLPSPYGIGDIGSASREFVDCLAAARQSWWQVLPLNEPGFGGSPYSALSAFAGNPALIDPDGLISDGLLDVVDWDSLLIRASWLKTLPEDRAALAEGAALKREALALAWARFSSNDGPSGLYDMFDDFCEEEAHWLEDYALYAALKERHRGADWREWPAELVRRDPAALEAARGELADAIGRHKFIQHTFARQWAELRDYAEDVGVRLIGDIPIFVAMDSADVWARRDQFMMDAAGRASVVAGVPPDYFSATGQKWGNPLYDWAAVERDGWSWWVDRVASATELCDLVRIDHFRGFEAYWEVPADAPDAIKGRWVSGPGARFFDAIQGALGDVPFIAEDLGLITDAVHQLRDQFHLPGMKVMHFAFGGEADHPFLPHTYPELCVAYAGTHDNDTTRGWFSQLSADEQHRVRVYLGCDDAGVVDAMRRRLYASDAALVIIVAQDVLGLGSEARMNTPATVVGNWSWRMTAAQLASPAWSALGAEVEGSRRQGV